MIRLIAAPPDAVLPGGTIDAQKGYPTADDTPEGRAHLTAHQRLSDVPLTIYRVRRDATWWVIVPDGTTLLTTLPGDIPGLLRRGSPCIRDGFRTVLVQTVYTNLPWLQVALDDGDVRRVAAAPGARCWLQLDLTDPTARSQTVAWVYAQPAARGLVGLTEPEIEACMETALYCAMDSEQINTLARLVLRLAGRAA